MSMLNNNVTQKIINYPEWRDDKNVLHKHKQEKTDKFCFEKFVVLLYKQQSKKTKVVKPIHVSG